jgi:hypothetical protein
VGITRGGILPPFSFWALRDLTLNLRIFHAKLALREFRKTPDYQILNSSKERMGTLPV